MPVTHERVVEALIRRGNCLYRFHSEDVAPLPMKLKVEINSREHFTVLGHRRVPFEVASRWFTGSADVSTYELDELLGTKLRALYQRKKGRDLFDLARALEEPTVNGERIVACSSDATRSSPATSRPSSRQDVRGISTPRSSPYSEGSWPGYRVTPGAVAGAAAEERHCPRRSLLARVLGTVGRPSRVRRLGARGDRSGPSRSVVR